MALPLIAGMVAIAAVGGIVQYLASAESKKLQAKERQRLEDLIDKLESPDFDTSSISIPDIKLMETYVPEVAAMVYEQAPELVSADSERALQGKGAQDAALAQFQNMARGDDPLSDLTMVKALEDAIEASGSQQDSIMRNMARQGISPGSSAYGQMQFQTAGQTQKNMFDAALQAAIAGQQRRQQAIGQSAQLGGNILGFETDLERMNDSTINELNRRNTEARRGFLTNRANTLNQAQRINQGESQRIAELNANNMYKERIRSQDLRNKQASANYQTDADKLSFKTGNNRFSDIAGKASDNSNAIQGVTDAAMLGMMFANQQPPSKKPNEQTNREYEQRY
jgi:hypothetical protein